MAVPADVLSYRVDRAEGAIETLKEDKANKDSLEDLKDEVRSMKRWLIGGILTVMTSSFGVMLTLIVTRAGA